MSSRANNKGFALISIVIFLAMVPLVMLIAVNLNSVVRTTWRTLQANRTKDGMAVIRNYLIANSSDADNDSWHELFKDEAGNSLPLSIPLNPNDQWGVAIRYCTWDLGSANGNATYSQNNIAPPKAQMIGKLISAGPDTTFQTVCSDATAKGDDIAVELYEADARGATGSLNGWQDVGGIIGMLNLGENVKVGTNATDTNNKLHVVAGAGTGGVLIDSGVNSNVTYPGMKLTSGGAGWGSGLQLNNSTAVTGHNYGVYSGSDGALHFADVGAGADRMTISPTGAVNVNGTLTATGLAMSATGGGGAGTYGFTYAP